MEGKKMGRFDGKGNKTIMKDPSNYLTQEQFEKVLWEARNSRKYSLVLRLLWETGIRCSELAHIRERDINLKEKSINVFWGKGGKNRIVYITPETAGLLGQWMNEVKDKSGYTIWRWGTHNRKSHRELILDQVKDYCSKAGLPHLFVHSFRHSFAIHWLKSGKDLLALKEILGHASLEMTEVYLKYADGRAKNEHQSVKFYKEEPQQAEEKDLPEVIQISKEEFSEFSRDKTCWYCNEKISLHHEICEHCKAPQNLREELRTDLLTQKEDYMQAIQDEVGGIKIKDKLRGDFFFFYDCVLEEIARGSINPI